MHRLPQRLHRRGVVFAQQGDAVDVHLVWRKYIKLEHFYFEYNNDFARVLSFGPCFGENKLSKNSCVLNIMM